MLERLMKINQDIEYNESLVIDIERNISEEENKIRELELESKDILNQIEISENNYQSKFNMCKEELEKVTLLEDKFDRYLNNISIFKNLNWKQKRELDFIVKNIKNKERKVIYQQILQELNEKERAYKK